MQSQAPGYQPRKPMTGVRKVQKQVRTGSKPGAKAKQQVRKTSRYSKNRAGVKTTVMAPGYRGMMMNQPIAHRQPVQSNNPGAFPFPGALM